MTFVLQYVRSNWPSSINSRSFKCRISVCLVAPSIRVWSRTSAIAGWLSSYVIVGFVCGYPSSDSSTRSDVTSVTVSIRLIISLAVVLSAMSFCSALRHETTVAFDLLPIMINLPDLLFRVSVSPARSASAYANRQLCGSKSVVLWNTIPSCRWSRNHASTPSPVL